MAVFKFRLEAVLRLRQRFKEEKEGELLALNQARRTLETEIAVLEQELRTMDEVLGAGVGEILSAIDLKLASQYTQRIDQSIKAKAATLTKLDAAIAGKRGELVEALRGVKSLERLRERQTNKFRREQESAEQKFTDEMAQRKFVVGPSRK
ncbi:MAG: flagellar export protein FliJ [Candidatus Binatia bacterium]